MRYEVKFRRYGDASTTVTSKIFDLSSPYSSEVEKAVRRYYNIPSSTRVDIISVTPA